MPVFALNASRTFWNESCSVPPHRDVTVIAPPAPPLPGAAEPPPPHAPTMKMAAIGSARIRGNLAIGLLLLTDGDTLPDLACEGRIVRQTSFHTRGSTARPVPGLGQRRSIARRRCSRVDRRTDPGWERVG